MSKEFLRDLANLLEKHNTAICSRTVGKYSEIFFQTHQYNPLTNVNTETHRLHVTAYDLRCLSGMSSKQANILYEINK